MKEKKWCEAPYIHFRTAFVSKHRISDSDIEDSLHDFQILG